MKALRAKYPDLPIALLLLGVSAILVWPASRWIAHQTFANEQLRQSFFLLGFAAVILWFENRESLKPVIAISHRNLWLLTAAFLLLGGGLLFPSPFIPLAAVALVLSAFVHVWFGDRGLKLTFPWIVGFGAFLLFVFFFPWVDWPLRGLAGVCSGQVLAWLGNDVALGTVTQSQGMLLLSVNRRLFEVAGECNGFGLISSSATLALLLVVPSRLSLHWKGLILVLAFASGFVFNIFRILGIIALAPFVGDHYHLMHEAVGVAAFFGGLGFLWWGIKRTLRNGSSGEETAGRLL